jgi:hypothetical protein
MASESKPGCEPDNDKDKYRCAKNCTLRFSDGSCGSYGADYCGPKTHPAIQTARYASPMGLADHMEQIFATKFKLSKTLNN